jgi:hypothetical protein
MPRLLVPTFDSHASLAILPFVVHLVALLSDADARERVEQSKYVKEPQHDANDDDGVQDRLDAACHGDETIHQPQEDSHDDQG